MPITVFLVLILVLALMIDVLPLQLKEDDTPAYLINAKHSGKYIEGNITSFRVLFTLPSWNGQEDDKYCVCRQWVYEIIKAGTISRSS
jgi:hypothetical protein